MTFDFSVGQKQLRSEARQFLSDRCPPKAVRAVLDGKRPFDRELWQSFADMGFPLSVPQILRAVVDDPWLAPAPADIIDRPDRPSSIVAREQNLRTTIPLKRKWRRRAREGSEYDVRYVVHEDRRLSPVGRGRFHETIGQLCPYSSLWKFRNIGNNFIHKSATATVPSPPRTTAAIAPNKAAVMPLSNAPS